MSCVFRQENPSYQAQCQVVLMATMKGIRLRVLPMSFSSIRYRSEQKCPKMDSGLEGRFYIDDLAQSSSKMRKGCVILPDSQRKLKALVSA